MRKFFSVIAWLVSLFSLIFVFAAIGDLVGGDSETETGILIGLLIFFSAITGGAGYLGKKLWGPPAFDPETVESQLLQLAAAHQGRITVAEASVGLKVPVKNARVALNHLVKEGAAETLVSESGELVFKVRGLLGAADKATAKGVLED